MIITAQQRLASKSKVNICIFGESGAGKTTQARTLPPEDTLFFDLEAGRLAIEGWGGDVLDAVDCAKILGGHPWEITRALTCLIGGPDPADIRNPKSSAAPGPYSKEMYDTYVAAFAQHGIDAASLQKYKLLFVDSITKASRWALQWAETQPDAWSEKRGAKDMLGAYGLLGRELKAWLTHLQHCPIGVVVVGILDRKEDDLGRVTYTPQIEGSQAGLALPGIFDEVLTLSMLTTDDGQKYRAFICKKDNALGLPAKDRSGCLNELEPPNLAALIEKIRAGKRVDQDIQTAMPQEVKA